MTFATAQLHGMIQIQSGVDIQLEGFEINGTEDTSHANTNAKAGVQLTGGTGGGTILMRDMRLHGFHTGSSQQDASNIDCVAGSDTLVQMRNCIFYDCYDDGLTVRVGGTIWHPDSYIDHCIVYGCVDRGFACTDSNSGVNLINCYSGGNVDNDFETRITNRFDLCWNLASDDTTASTICEQGAVTGASPATVLRDPSNEIFVLLLAQMFL